MKQKHCRSLFTVLLLVFLLVLSACGGSAYKTDYSGNFAVDSGSRDRFSSENGAGFGYEESYDEYEEVPQSSPVSGDSSQILKKQDQILVYSCRMTIETLEFQETLQHLKDLVVKYEGMTQELDISDSDDYWYYSNHEKNRATLRASLVLRIPTASYHAFMNDLQGQGKIIDQNQTIENITRSYYDTSATVEALRIQEERLLQMMKEADEISDMLSIESRLSEVQQELNRYKTQLDIMDTDAAYSTFRIELREVAEYSVQTAPLKTSTFMDRLKNTVRESGENVLLFMEDLLFFLIRALPILLILAVLLGIIFFPIRSLIRKGRMKRGKKVKYMVSGKAEPDHSPASSEDISEQE